MPVEARLFALVRRAERGQRHEGNPLELGMHPEMAGHFIAICPGQSDVRNDAVRLKSLGGRKRVQAIVHSLDFEAAHLQESSEESQCIQVVFHQKDPAAPSAYVHTFTSSTSQYGHSR
jgi:hypothetical protein